MAKIAPAPEAGVSGLVIDPERFPEASAPIEAGRPNDRLAHFRRYIDSKSCYNSAVLPEAVVRDVRNRVAYQIEMWTLMERRFVVWLEKPFNGEPVPHEGVGNLFTNYDFPPPPTIIKGKQESTEALHETQHDTACPSCGGQGTTRCSWCSGTGRTKCYSCGGSGNSSDGNRCGSCNGSGSSLCSSCHGSRRKDCTRCATVGRLLRWAVIHVEWHTINSVTFAQNTFLPNKNILRAGGKVVDFEEDDPWATETSSKTWQRHPTLDAHPTVYKWIKKNSPVPFEASINEQYQKQHLGKLKEDMHIRNIKISIQRLDILETDYSSGTYKNTKNPKRGNLLDLLKLSLPLPTKSFLYPDL